MNSSYITYVFLVHSVCATCDGVAKDSKVCKAPSTTEEVVMVQRVAAKVNSTPGKRDQAKPGAVLKVAYGGQQDRLVPDQNVPVGSCDDQLCVLTPVAADQVDKVIIGGKDPLPPSLRGIFFMDGNALPDEILSFGGLVGAGPVPTDGMMTGSAEVYAPQVATFVGSAGAALYSILTLLEVRYMGQCSIKNSDAVACQIMPAVAKGEVVFPPGQLFNWTMQVAPDEFGEEGGINWIRQSTSFGQQNTYIARRIVDENGKRLPINWEYYLKTVQEKGTGDSQYYAMGTGQPPLKPLHRLMQLIQNIDTSDLPAVLLELLGPLLEELKQVTYKDNVPVTDVFEYKILHEAMCPLENVFEILKAGSEINGAAGILDKMQMIIRSRMFTAASKAQGNVPINVITDPVLNTQGPVPGITWKAIDTSILLGVALPLFIGVAGGNRTLTFMNFAAESCWEPVLLGDGPQYFKYHETDAQQSDPYSLRGYYTATVPSAAYIFNPDAAIFLSTGQPQHTDLRKSYEDIGFARKYPVPMELISKVDWSAFAEDGSIDSSMIGKISLPTMLYMLYGEVPPPDVVLEVGPYLTWGQLGIFGKPAEVLLGPVGTTKNLEHMRAVAREWAATTAGAKEDLRNPVTLDYMAKFPGLSTANPALNYTTEPQNFLQNMIDISLFAGYLGTSDLTKKCLFFANQSESLRQSFEKNPELFVIEVMRYDSAVTSTTPLFSKDTKVLLEGKYVKFARGQPYQSVIATANRDLNKFKHGDVLDPERDNLGDALSWNGRNRWVEARSFEKAPRYCPGYCASIKAGAAMCAKFLGDGLFERMSHEGKIGGPVICSNFGPKDCVGHWTDWTNCSRECDSGFRTKTFIVTQPMEPGGKPCDVQDGGVVRERCRQKTCKKTSPSPMETTLYDEIQMCPSDVLLIQQALLQMVGDVYIQGQPFGHLFESFQLSPIFLALVAQIGQSDATEILAGLLYTFAGVLDRDNRSALYGLPEFDEFTLLTFTNLVHVGLRNLGGTLSGLEVDVPYQQFVAPCSRAGIFCIPRYDIDWPNQTQEFPGGPNAFGCGFEGWEHLVMRDDFTVSMRNRWDLVDYDQYLTPAITNALGHPFGYNGGTKKDYIQEKFVWYTQDNGRGVYKDEVVNFRQLFWNNKLDIWDDACEKFIAFGNMGSHRLELVKGMEIGGETVAYKIALSAYSNVIMRQGEAKIGSDMYFSSTGLPIMIEAFGRRYLRPGSGLHAATSKEWQYWKYQWRSSLMVVVTLQDHLLSAHLTSAASLTWATRAYLPPAHPLRRFLTRATFGTIQINTNSLFTLVTGKQLLDRQTGFADFESTRDFAVGLIKPYPEQLKAFMDSSSALASSPLFAQTPYFVDGSDLYNINGNFLKDFIAVYADTWCTADGDPAISNFLSGLQSQFESMGLASLYSWGEGTICEQLVAILTPFLFVVSGYHVQVGGLIADMALDPDFGQFSWPAIGADSEWGKMPPVGGRPKQALLTAVLMAATSLPTPFLTGDYSHLCKGIALSDSCVDVFNKYQKSYGELAAVIAKRNEQRIAPYIAMQPDRIAPTINM